MKALKEMIFENLPDLAKQAAKFPEEIEDVKKYAKNEFDALNALNKAKATAALAINIKIL